jgi:predicted  nucleic acid-binding Zn-ribbon protein
MRRGLQDIKTSGGLNVQSIPRTYRSKYLSLFMLDNEQEKLEKELEMLSNKMQAKQKRLDEIAKLRAELEGFPEDESSPKKAEVKPKPAGKWHIMTIDY